MKNTISPKRLADIAARAISTAGGGAALARHLGIKRASVQGWKSTAIPAERVPAVSRITGIPLHELRPDLYQSDDDAALRASAQAARRDTAPVVA